jgi:hypothetical protein
MQELLPSFESTREFHSLLASTHLSLGLLPRCTLFASFPGHAGRTGARTNSKPFAREPRLEDAPYDIEGARLHYSAANELAAPYTNVDDALKSEGESVGSMLVKRFWDQGRDGFGWMVVGWQEAIEEGRILRRRRGNTKIVQHAHKTLKAAVHDHDLSYSRRGWGKVGEMGKGVE